VPTESDADVRRLFDDLVDLDALRRAARISELGIAPVVAAEVSALLAAADSAGDFLRLIDRPGDTGSSEANSRHRPGDVVATRYTLLAHVGQGATGEVYLAWDQQLERRVALKFLRSGLNVDSAARARLVAEARAAAKLDHAHVANVHDIGEGAPGQFFIAMPYYSGETLRDRIARGPLSESESLRIAVQISGALCAAHAAGIVHCDLKPANVLFDANDDVRLADFGAAKWLAGDSTLQHGAVAGTIAYMSPEQARGETVDGRTDVWALGVVLYEMLAGERPFAGPDAATALTALLNEAPMPLPEDVQAAPGLRVLVMQLLTKDPARRPPSAASVRDALERLIVESDGAGSISAAGFAIGNLPRPLTSFVGREREIIHASELLCRTRLLTLTGTGGTGKTRLAIELSRRLRDEFADGIRFVPLAEIADPALIPSLLARALGLRDLGGAIGERVIGALRERSALIVLDNFEHVIAGARFVSTLLAACPKIRVLATSRVSLGIQGEQELQIPPLAPPMREDRDPASNEAVQLFVQRALAVRPSFVLNGENVAVVAEICRRLDGLPLALELAGARAKLLSPRAMLTRLEHRFDLLRTDSTDRPERHATMHAVIDWSYVLLTREEKHLFCNLAVFVGSVSLQAAEAAMSVGVPSATQSSATQSSPARSSATLELLTSLCNKSLLWYDEQADGEPVFVMLETVREFATDRLRGSGHESEVRRAHVAYCLSVAEEAADRLRGPDQVKWLDRLELEYPNFRVALDYVLDCEGDAFAAGLRDAARLAVALHRFWLTRGPLLEGTEYFRRITALAGSAHGQAAGLDIGLRAAVLSGAAQLANTKSVFPEARRLFERSLELHREAGNDAGVATTLNSLAWTLWILGDMAAGEAMACSAMEMHRQAENALGVTLSLNTLAWVAMERGRYSEAAAHFANALAAHYARGDRRAAAFTIGWTGLLAQRQGELSRAISLHQQAIDMLEPVADRGYRILSSVRLAAARHARNDSGDHAAAIEAGYLSLLQEEGRLWPIAYALTELGAILRDNGDLDRAAETLHRALDTRRQTGALQGRAEAQLLLGTVYELKGDSTLARATVIRALQDAIEFGAIPVVAECVEALATNAAGERDFERAAILFGASASARSALGSPRALRYESPYATSLARLSAMMPPGRFHEEFSTGSAMTIELAAAIALSPLS
jgi:non-specific serine/threonine protein kinase